MDIWSARTRGKERIEIEGPKMVNHEGGDFVRFYRGQGIFSRQEFLDKIRKNDIVLIFESIFNLLFSINILIILSVINKVDV